MDIWQYSVLKSHLLVPRNEALAGKAANTFWLTRYSFFLRTASRFGEVLIWFGSQIKQRSQQLADSTCSPRTRLKTITID
jgi:hypothetical protein